jgi:hypothetical protein
VANFAMIFAVRGTETTFDNLRALGWYDAIPQLGAVLFVAGWSSGKRESPLPRSIQPPRLRELGAVTMFAVVILLLQTPRARRVIFQYDGAAAPIAQEDSAGSGHGRLRSRAELVERAGSQRRALAELDRLEQAAGQDGRRRTTLRPTEDRIAVPGMPEHLPDFHASDLLDGSRPPDATPGTPL